jgi:hypothetical protein
VIAAVVLSHSEQACVCECASVALGHRPALKIQHILNKCSLSLLVLMKAAVYRKSVKYTLNSDMSRYTNDGLR